MSIIYQISQKEIFIIKLFNDIFNNVSNKINFSFRYTKIANYQEPSLNIHLNTFDGVSTKDFYKLHQEISNYLNKNLFDNQIYISNINSGFYFKFYLKHELSDNLITFFKMKGL